MAAGYPPEDTLDEAEIAAARWAWSSNRAAGRDSDTLPGAKWLFLPMRTGRGAIGIIGITRDDNGPLLTPDQRHLLDALADQGALAIERVHLVEDIDRVKRAAEADRLRSALLTSVSHDLKTPLSSIIGAAGALRDLTASLGDGAKAELLTVIIEESERLNRFIANLLDMTRLESGAVMPNAAPHDISDIVGTAIQRAAKILAGHRLVVDVNSELPMVNVDAVLFEQVLFNLLDNAAKYAPASTPITLRSWRDHNELRFSVEDQGPAISEAERERIFEPFFRGEHRPSGIRGTGLGLSTARQLAELQRGRMCYETTGTGRGRFVLSLPAADVPTRELSPESL